MHEVSIALSLLERIVEECEKNGYSKVVAVTVDVGRASGIMPDALSFSFEALKTDTRASEAILTINDVAIKALCNNCGSEFSTEDAYVFMCPHCSSNSFTMLSGRELNITEIEVQ